MAGLLAFENLANLIVWINPTHVASVISIGDNRTQIRMVGEEEGIPIKGDADDIAHRIDVAICS